MKLEEVYKKLGLDKSSGLFLTKEELWKNDTSFPNRIKRLIERKIKPDAFFCFDNKPLILFFSNPSDKNKLHKEIWNFNECPIAIIVENDVVEIFNGFCFDKNVELLKKIGGEEKLNDFSYFELVTGKTWEQYNDDLSYKNRVDYHLLENIKAARDILTNDYKLDTKITNALIGKSIFVRYLVDRQVKMKFDGRLRIWTNSEFCDLLNSPQIIRQFFDYLENEEKGFNGDLFPLTSSEYREVSKKHYLVIRRLLLGEEIVTGQPSLFQLYDFSIIPIEFISNVYELFIGQNNQEKEGAYYTPLFLVDYILKETVEKKLNEFNSNYDCKVLDPACGSGIFLVETLRKIIEKYIIQTGIDTKSQSFKTAIKNLAKENIYGIDKDESAVQVAVFSIYLTLLDYLEPPGIETFKFPILLETNFLVADFFDESLPFNNSLKKIAFDFILGNPPWMRGKGEKEKPLYVKYIDKRKEREILKPEPQIEIGNREIAQAFVLRCSDFSSTNTKCALIVTSKVLYNLKSNKFRKYFLHNFLIDRIFELAPVRREVFDKSNDKAVAPACILFFNYANGSDTDSNVIQHIALKPSRFFSLFKIFTITRSDFKTIGQSKLKQFDWLWKVLVYGSYLDFNFIKRLYTDYDTVKDIITKEGILFKQGLKRKDGNKSIPVKELVGKSFLDTQKKQLKPFNITDLNIEWNSETVGYIYKENGTPFLDLYKPYSLLIAGGIFNDFTSNAAINKKERVFTSSIRALKIFNKSQLSTLYSINTLLCSSLFAYYMLSLGASAGIEREESEDEELEKMWFIRFTDIVKKGEEIESEINQQNRILSPVKNKNITTYTDPIIFEELNLSDIEIELIDFATTSSIPISMRHEGYEKLFEPLKYKDAKLEEYASLFIDRFKTRFDSKSNKFIVEIWHTKQIVGMFFKIVAISDYSDSIIWVNKQNDDSKVLTFLAKMSSERITDQLFVQKDIRGFDKESFYIFKPNEKRLWHKAIGYLDVNEFADAILKAGKKRK